MEQRGGECNVDYYYPPIVIKPTSFYEHYGRPLAANDQLIVARESYLAQGQVPPVRAHQQQPHGSPYNHHSSYHHHSHHHHHEYSRGTDVTGYDDDVMHESAAPRCVTSFTELQPARRSAAGQSLVGATDWTATSPPFTAHSHQHCK